MLGSFQNLYPTSCLLTELVQIYNGKYIVKASLQIEGITRTTGMAAAEILEEAEDRSRERALAIFGITDSTIPEQVPTPTQPNTLAKLTVGEAAPKELGIAIATPNSIPVTTEIAKTPQATQGIAANNPTTKIKANIVEIEEKLDTKSNRISTKKPQELHTPEPELESESKPALESPLEFEEVVTPAPRKSTSSTKTKADVNSKELNQDSDKDLSLNANEITTVVTQPETPPEQLFDISLEPFADSKPAPEPELPAGFAGSNTATTNVVPFTSSDIASHSLREYHNPAEEIEIPLSPAPTPATTPATTTSKRKKKSEPEDNSDDIAKIGVEMQRLHWTVEQGKDYLFQTYAKKSRHSLTPDELRDFRQYLESQDTPEDPLAIDPIAGF
jgi:DNA polymerase III gamma/tau subunit